MANTGKGNKGKKKSKEENKKLPENIKNFAQSMIAICIVVLLVIKLFYRVSLIINWDGFGNGYLVGILRLPTLEIVSKALAYSAGIDLAYMLTTPGPDEAIEPLILGLASAILFSVSKIEGPKIELALEIGLYVLVLAGLFLMKEYFITPGKNEKTSNFWKRVLALRKAKK